MKRILLLFVASIISMGSYAQITHYIDVTGKAERTVAPDRFELQITIDETSTKGKVSIQELEADMLRMLKSQKIDCEKNLTMKYMSSDYAKRKGTLSAATYILRLEDGELLQRVYNELSELDITSLQLLKSYSSQQDRYEAEARSEALLNAREVARSMAATFDQKIGVCFYMSYNVSYANPRNNSDVVFVAYSESKAKERTGALTPLSFEKQTITARVAAKFVLMLPEQMQNP